MPLLRQNPADIAQRLIAMIEVESHLHYHSQDCLHSSHNEVCCFFATTTVKTRAKVVHWLYESVGLVIVTPFIAHDSHRSHKCTSKTTIWSRVPACRIVVPLPCHKGGGIVVRPPRLCVAIITASTTSAAYVAALSHSAHSTAEIVSTEWIILEGLGWHLSHPTSALIVVGGGAGSFHSLDETELPPFTFPIQLYSRVRPHMVRPVRRQIKDCQTTEPRTFDSEFSGKVILSTLGFNGTPTYLLTTLCVPYIT